MMFSGYIDENILSNLYKESFFDVIAP